MANCKSIRLDGTSYAIYDESAHEAISQEVTDREEAIQAETDARQAAIQAETTARNQAINQLKSDLQGQIDAIVADGSLKSAKFVTPQMFGAVGDGSTDDTDAFEAAISYCYENGYALYIPQTGNLDVPAGYNGYILSRTLNIVKPMTIIADPLSVLFWRDMTATDFVESGVDPTTGATTYKDGIGINIDYGNYRNHKGTYKFGIIQGNQTYVYPGASAPSGKYGCAVRIANGDLVNFYAKYVSYWNQGILVEANADFTGNETIEWDVMDDCQEGLIFRTVGANVIEGVNVKFNTIGLCKLGIVFYANNPSGGHIHGITIEGAEIWTEYTKGACIYTQTTQDIVYNVNIKIQELYNVCNPATSKEGISEPYYGPFIAGSGNNCFKGTNVTLNCGCVVSDDSQLAMNGGVGLDGQLKFINLVEQFSNVYDTAYECATTKSGQFNNGKYPLGNAMFVKVTLGSQLNAGQATSFYAKFQGVPSGGNCDLKIMPCAGYPVVMTIGNVSDYSDYQTIKIDVCAISQQASGTSFWAIVSR